MEELIIVGGGVAGLSCLNTLLDHHVSPLLIEAKQIGSPKICGEFIAPTAISELEEWQIGPLQSIKAIHFIAGKKNFLLELPKHAAAISRIEVEMQLKNRAISKGGRILEYAPIMKITQIQNNHFEIRLSNQDIINTKKIIYATGRIGTNNAAKNKYIALKFYLPTIFSQDILKMYCVNQGYFGIVPISPSRSNCAALFKLNLQNQNNKKLFMQEMNKISELSHIDLNFYEDDILMTHLPEFRMRLNNASSQEMYIGDAIANLPPAIGSGFAHSITSGKLAAQFYLNGNANEFIFQSKKDAQKKLLYGKLIHSLLLNSKYSKHLFPLLDVKNLFSRFILSQIEFS